jgi:hypothetical protein
MIKGQTNEVYDHPVRITLFITKAKTCEPTIGSVEAAAAFLRTQGFCEIEGLRIESVSK